MTENFVPQNGRRIITLDLETISLDPNNHPKGALGTGGSGVAPGEMSQIVVAGMLIDDGERLTAAPACDLDERRVLEKFWRTLRPEDTLVGFHIRDWDIVRIKQRSWILGVRPTVDLNLAKYRETNVVDVMELWTNWSPRIAGVRLEDIARALRVGHKSGDSADLEEMWRAGRHKDVLDHCMEHVYLTYLIYCRMHYRDPLPFNLPKPAPADFHHAASPDFTAPLRESIDIANARPAPWRDPKATPMPLPLRDPEPTPAPRYVNEAPDGRYGYKSDGRGGLIPTMPERSSPVVGFGAANPAPPVYPDAGRAPAAEKTQNGGRPRSPARRGGKRVFFTVDGGNLRFSGGTFPIKDSLKAIGARPTGEGQAFAWELPESRFNDVAGLCARAGLALVPAQPAAA